MTTRRPDPFGIQCFRALSITSPNGKTPFSRVKLMGRKVLRLIMAVALVAEVAGSPIYVYPATSVLLPLPAAFAH